MSAIVRSTRMLWSSHDASNCPYDALMSTFVCTSLLRTTTSTTNASLPTILRANGLLWCTYDATNGPYDAIVPTVVCPSRMLRSSYDGSTNASLSTIVRTSMLCTTPTTTNACLSAIVCTNGLLCTSHASHATTKLYAILCSKLLYGKEIDST